MAAEFGLGRFVHLDDYPYVHLMRRISAEQPRLDGKPVFFASDVTPFIEPADWGTLIHLINEDYADLHRPLETESPSAGIWLLLRFERARQRIGLGSPLEGFPDGARADLIRAVERDARRLWVDRQRIMESGAAGATVVIEFARGGPEGAARPLEDPHGYRYSLGRLSPEILGRASILNVWVTPEESRHRNTERARAGISSGASILHHAVPEPVMEQDYGTDDLLWLIEQSDRPDTIRIEAHGSVYYLPVVVFDNQTDKTSFLRGDPGTWPAESVARLHRELKSAFGSLVRGT
jgi:hypothetical protein